MRIGSVRFLGVRSTAIALLSVPQGTPYYREEWLIC